MKIALCVPARTTDCKIWFAVSLAQTRWPINSEIAIVNTNGQSVRNGPQNMIEVALEHKPDWIVFVGVDIGWSPDAFTRLISHDKDIIGGWSNGRFPPYKCHVCDWANEEYNAFRVVNNPQDRHGIEKVCTVGGEMFMVKPSVFERVKYPWFFGNDMVSANGRLMSEDYYFCKKAHDAGIETWVDWDVHLQHTVDGLVTFEGKVVQYQRI